MMDLASTIPNYDIISNEINCLLDEKYPNPSSKIVYDRISKRMLYSNDDGATGMLLCKELFVEIIQIRLIKKYGVKVAKSTIKTVWEILFSLAPKVDPFTSYISKLDMVDDGVPYQDAFIDMFKLSPANGDIMRLRGAVTDFFQSTILRGNGEQQDANWFPGNIMVIDCTDEDVRLAVHFLLDYLGRFGKYNGFFRWEQHVLENQHIAGPRARTHKDGKVLEIRAFRNFRNISRNGFFDNMQRFSISTHANWYPVITTVNGAAFKTLEDESWRYFKVKCDESICDMDMFSLKEQVMGDMENMWAKAYRQDRSVYKKLRPNYSFLHVPAMKQQFEEFTKATYAGCDE